jgi:hypothetical protein
VASQEGLRFTNILSLSNSVRYHLLQHKLYCSLTPLSTYFYSVIMLCSHTVGTSNNKGTVYSYPGLQNCLMQNLCPNCSVHEHKMTPNFWDANYFRIKCTWYLGSSAKETDTASTVCICTRKVLFSGRGFK